MRRALTGVAVVVLAWLGVAIGLFLLPRTDSPKQADAVVVLSGDLHSRLDRALGLMRRHVAPVLVISGWPDPLYRAAAPYCEGRSELRVICLWPKPYSTRGEARTISKLARARGWRNLVVVTSDFHVFRARMLFRRCWRGGLQMVGANASAGTEIIALATETAKLGVALTTRRGC